MASKENGELKVKKDWEIKKLGEVCTYFKQQGKYDDLPYVGMEDIESKTGIYLGSENISSVQSSTFFFEKNDVLFGRLRPYLAKVYLAEFSGHCSTEIFPIRVKKDLLAPYLKLWLLSDKTINSINETCTGARMPRANMNEVLSFEILVPPLEEQKRIVKILDEKFAQLESLKATAQTNLQNAKDLFQSQLTKAFSNTTWEKKKLGDSSELITKGSSPKWQGINYVTDDGILFVTSENVRENYIDLEKSKYLEKKFNDKQKRSILKKNDVLVNIVGASIGRAAIFDFDIVDANINQAVALIRSKNEIDVHFLSYFLNSDNAMNQYNNAKKDTARANLSLEDINNLRIPLPLLPEQKRIVKELDTLSEKVRQLQEIYTKQIANCDELKQSLLQKAFEGEF